MTTPLESFKRVTQNKRVTQSPKITQRQQALRLLKFTETSFSRRSNL